jgi:hypothetical protein
MSTRSNTPRTGIMLSVLAQGTFAALLGTTLACNASSPTRPTPTPVAPATVAPAPVAPAPLAPAVYTLTAGINGVAPGDQLSVNWAASPGGGADWIGLFRVGAPNTAYDFWWSYTNGKTSGSFTFSAPVQAGQYEFRYLLDDGFDDVARSGVVIVG